MLSLSEIVPNCQRTSNANIGRDFLNVFTGNWNKPLRKLKAVFICEKNSSSRMVMDAEEAEEERLIGECLAILGKPLPEVLAGHAAYCKRAKQALNEEQASVDPM